MFPHRLDRTTKAALAAAGLLFFAATVPTVHTPVPEL